MNVFSLKLAERVIRAADREHPADAVLREVLKGERDLTSEQRSRISAAVFAWFRWRGWLDRAQPMQRQVEHASDLAERYAANPQSFTDEELLARAVPSWVAGVMEVSPAWVRALQSPPRLWLRARRGQGQTLARKLGDCQAFGQQPPTPFGVHPCSTTVHTLKGGHQTPEGGPTEAWRGDALEYRGSTDLFRTAEFHAGEFELQDISSQAVGLICAPQPGETWWDACAGEGGKTLHLSALMENQGLVWASDTAAWRLQKLKRRAARAQVFNYRVAPWDGSARLPTKTKFDGVLMDAPCTGIGTWQRNPHARWTLTTRDVEELSRLQATILANAAPALKPGGKLVYAVCTLTRAETQGVAEAFEAKFPEFERLPVSDPLHPGTPTSRQAEIWPQQSGGSGMFVAAWTRRKP